MRDYSLGYRTVGYYGRPQLVHPKLKRIAAKCERTAKVKLDREIAAIASGRIQGQMIGDKLIVIERGRKRVGKYFSVNGGKFEPSIVTKVRNSRSRSLEPTNDGKVAKTKAAIVKDVPKRTKIVQTSEYVIRLNGEAYSIGVKSLPAHAH